MAEIFSKILEERKLYTEMLAEAGVATKRVSEAREWFRQQAMETVVRSPARVVTEGALHTTKARNGFMYMFQYDPKMKKELPYYDRFPLIFPFRVTKEGFCGINLHYLPYDYRAKLMDNLYTITNNKNYDNTTKLKLSYSLLESTAKFKYFRPCIKQYLNSHVKSRLLFIPANQWDIALFLPVARFVKAKESAVFSDSRRKIKQSR